MKWKEKKIKRAEEGILELQKYVDNLIVIPNQNIFHLAKPQTSFTDSLQFADNVLIDGVKSIIDLMVNPGIMNHDFADVRAIMSETGKVHLGTGVAEGENRVMEATEIAISNPLLENNSMKGAKVVLINVTCSDDTSLHDIDLAINRVQQESDEDANIIWGVQKDNNLKGKFKISVISTGIDCENYFKNLVKENEIPKINDYEEPKEFFEKSLIQQNLIILKLHKQASLLTFNRHPQKNENTEIDSLENKVETNDETKKINILQNFGLSNKTNVKNIPESQSLTTQLNLKTKLKKFLKIIKKKTVSLILKKMIMVKKLIMNLKKN